MRECGLKFRTCFIFFCANFVTPLAGVWIEISGFYEKWVQPLSLPLRECGLKFRRIHKSGTAARVTPLAGVWIEIIQDGYDFPGFAVTPLAGVWIEIGMP